MSYKVNQDGDKFNIFEVGTDQTIELETSEKRARDLCRKMNLGSGFNGWTPSFFAVKYPLSVS